MYNMLSFVCFRVAKKSNHFLAIPKRYLKECALIHISMSIIEKVFKYEETELSVINCVKMIYGLEVRT